LIAFYAKYLASCLIVQELNAAKYLWKRLPATLKTEDQPLFSIWNIGKKIWVNDLSGAFAAVSFLAEKFPALNGFGEDIVQGIRQSQIKNIMKSFSVINMTTLCSRTNLSLEEAVAGTIMSFSFLSVKTYHS
jgi:COP9 signalosome complex subunit 8